MGQKHKRAWLFPEKADGFGKRQRFFTNLQNEVKNKPICHWHSDGETLRGVHKAIYQDDYPASTWVQISRLFMAEAKLEIEVVAHLPR